MSKPTTYREILDKLQADTLLLHKKHTGMFPTDIYRKPREEAEAAIKALVEEHVITPDVPVNTLWENQLRKSQRERNKTL